jgi:type II secretory pathway component PulF
MTLDECKRKALDEQRSIAYDIMVTAFKRNLSTVKALEVGAASMYDKGLKIAFLLMIDSLDKGDSLEEAMRKTGFEFYDYEYEEMRKGENRGEIDVALQGLAKRLNPNP